jgi:hypothetical protein
MKKILMMMNHYFPLPGRAMMKMNYYSIAQNSCQSASTKESNYKASPKG